MRKLLLLSLLLVACNHTAPAPEQDSEAQAEKKSEAKVESCLTSETMSLQWGDCNVQKTIYDAIPKLSRCVRQAKANSYPSDAELDFQLHILKNGKVKWAKLVSGRTKNKKLNLCLQKELKKLQFATPPVDTKPEFMVPLSLVDLK